MKVSELVEYLKTLPQDYEVWGNSGYYDYSDYRFGSPQDVANLNEAEARVDIACSGS